MIELPEAITFARQMIESIEGRRIENCIRGNTPHKFAFYSRSPEEYAQILKGRMISKSHAH